MVSVVVMCWIIGALVIGPAWGLPVSESHPLGLVSDITSRLGAHPARLQETRLSLPSSQELEAIKKVAQILVMLGQQVIPAIIGEPGLSETVLAGEEIPNDTVNFEKRIY